MDIQIQKSIDRAIRLHEQQYHKEIVKHPKFIEPTAKELEDYSKSIDFHLDARQFIDFYEAKGWMIGKNKMKDWRAAVRTWQKRQIPTNTDRTQKLLDEIEREKNANNTTRPIHKRGSSGSMA